MLALLTLLLAAPTPVATAAAPTCKADVIAVVEKGLAQLRPEQQHVFALRGVTEACTLPEGLAKGARAFDTAPPSSRPMLVAKAISQSLPQWTAACPGGVETLQRMMQVAPATRTLTLWKQCNIERFGIPLKAMGKPANLSPLGLMLGHVVHTWNPKAAPLLVKSLLSAPL